MNVAELWKLPIWDSEQCAAAMGWTPGELTSQRFKHGFPTVKSGKQVRFMRDSVLRWASENEVRRETGEDLVADE